MRISDWSSDVCSSDLNRRIAGTRGEGRPRAGSRARPATRRSARHENRGNDRRAHRIDAPCARMCGNEKRSLPDTERLRSQVKPYSIKAKARAIKATVNRKNRRMRSEEHTSELQSLMRISYAVFCLKKKK